MPKLEQQYVCRFDVYVFTEKGHRLRSLEQLGDYLASTGTPFHPDTFTKDLFRPTCLPSTQPVSSGSRLQYGNAEEAHYPWIKLAGLTLKRIQQPLDNMATGQAAAGQAVDLIASDSSQFR